MGMRQKQSYDNDHTPSVIIPHKGSICKIHLHQKGSSTINSNFMYAITIDTSNTYSKIIDNTEAIPSPVKKGKSTTTNSPLHSDQPNQHHEQPLPLNFELSFTQGHFNFLSDIFSILDTDSRGVVHKSHIQEFVDLRCHVFRRRDRALERYLFSKSNDEEATIEKTTSIDNEGKEKEKKEHSPFIRTTFEEVWNAVVGCCSRIINYVKDADDNMRLSSISNLSLIGIEGWMVFSRFISLAQYQEAKRRFSSRHLQQVMIQKHGVEGEGGMDVNRERGYGAVSDYGEEEEIDGRLEEQNEEKREGIGERHNVELNDEGGNNGIVLVNVPPPESPAPITVRELVDYETLANKNSEAVALPELDLDHSHVSAHDTTNLQKFREEIHYGGRGTVKIKVFCKSNSTTSNRLAHFTSCQTSEEAKNLDFVVKYFPPLDESFSSESSAGTKYSRNVNTHDSKGIVVKRSFADFLWLHHLFTSQKDHGGTLSGRILPPFPSHVGNKYTDYEDKYLSPQGGFHRKSSNATAPAMAVATASVGMISSAAKSAKSFLGGYLSSSTFSQGQTVSTNNISHSKCSIGTDVCYTLQRDVSLFSSYLSKANQIERYLNFLLEHPSLSTSFPLNVILKASQSGLECAKKFLSSHVKCHYPNVSSSLAGYNSIPSNPTASCPDNSPSFMEKNSHHQQSSSQSMNQSWIRTAAQAALALKLHGVLETTGCQSASAKLIDASLPNIYSSSLSSWTDFDTDDMITMDNKNLEKYSNKNHGDIVDEFVRGNDGADGSVKDTEESESTFCEFEKGVVSIKSELKTEVVDEEGEALDYCSDEYDMLPAPISLPNTSALCAGSLSHIKKEQQGNILSKKIDMKRVDTSDDLTNNTNRYHHQQQEQQQQQHRYYYGGSDDDLGDVSVDTDIDKLRDILSSLNKTLGMCLAATMQIGEGVSQRIKLHLSILRGLDSCEGIRGAIITQRSLLEGVTSLEKGYHIYDTNAMEFSRGLSWNKALASSAVHAAEEVRDAVKVSRRASRAKDAAYVAAQKVQNEWENARFSTNEETRAAHTRVSNSQTQAIHAAVVEHATLTAKRRATMALAHDIKCWNVHRKREILNACLKSVKAQRDATRHSTTAWVLLRDGLLEMSSFPKITIQTRIKVSETTAEINSPTNSLPSETLKEDGETSSFGLGINSLVSLNDKKNIDESEHHLFVDHFAALSNEDSIKPKAVNSMKLNNGDELNNNHNFSSSPTQFMDITEKIQSDRQESQDMSANPLQACSSTENETSLRPQSSLKKNSCAYPFSTTNDACPSLDDDRLEFTEEKMMNTEMSVIDGQLNQVFAPVGVQSSPRMNQLTNNMRPLDLNADGNRDGTLEDGDGTFGDRCRTVEDESSNGNRDGEGPTLTKSLNLQHESAVNSFIEASRIKDQPVMLQSMDDSNTSPKPLNINILDSTFAAIDCIEENTATASCSGEKIEPKTESENIWNLVDDLTSPPLPQISDNDDNRINVTQHSQEEPTMGEGNMEFNTGNENIWNDIASSLDQNGPDDEKQLEANNCTEVSDTISDLVGVAGCLDDEDNVKDNATKEQESKKVSSSHQQRIGLTDSMQSLVDGLMMWGGQWDSEDDLSLPRGMAASLAMDESGILH